MQNAAGSRCKRCVDGQLFGEVVSMKEKMISSFEYVVPGHCSGNGLHS